MTSEPQDCDEGTDGPVRFNGGPLSGCEAEVPDGPEVGVTATLLLSCVDGAWHAYQMVQTNADQPCELSYLGRVERLPTLVQD